MTTHLVELLNKIRQLMVWGIGQYVFILLLPSNHLVSNTGDCKIRQKKALNESYLKEMVMPQSGELFGRVIKLVGGDNIIVKSSDGRIRTCRIRGKIKRKCGLEITTLFLLLLGTFSQIKQT